MPCLSTEQVQPGKRQCNVPVCLNPDLEGQALRMRGECSHVRNGRHCICPSLSLPAGAETSGLAALGHGSHLCSDTSGERECVTSLNRTNRKFFLRETFQPSGPRQTSLVSLHSHLLLIPQSALEHTPLGPLVFLPIGVRFACHPESASPGPVQLLCVPSRMVRARMNGLLSAF